MGRGLRGAWRWSFKDIEPYTEPGTRVLRDGKMYVLTVALHLVSSLGYTERAFYPLSSLQSADGHRHGSQKHTLSAT